MDIAARLERDDGQAIDWRADGTDAAALQYRHALARVQDAQMTAFGIMDYERWSDLCVIEDRLRTLAAQECAA